MSASNLPALRRDLTETGLLGTEDQAALERAFRLLEHPSLTARLTDALGRRLGSFKRLLPMGVSSVVVAAADRAIHAALSVALQSLDDTRLRKARGVPGMLARALEARDLRGLHKVAAVASGAAGGAFGLASLPVELPVSTIIILRSIADIARSEGEDLSDPKVALACLEVFALGGEAKTDNLSDGGYFAVRTMLATALNDAGRYIVAQGITGELGGPVLVRFISQVSSRFGIVVSEKLATQAIPIVGAIGGAAINYAFVQHFQSMASGHFTVRRLERRYGEGVVRAAYERLRGGGEAGA